MALNRLTKGEPDWHTPLNENFDQIDEALGGGGGGGFATQEQLQAVETLANDAQTAADSKIAQPTATSPAQGLAHYNKTTGETTLLDGTPAAMQPWHYVYSMPTHRLDISDPSVVTYAGTNISYTPAVGTALNDWAASELLRCFRPCVIRPSDTEPNYFLDPTDMTKKEDGTSPATLTGLDGDVMVQIKKMYGTVLSKDSVVNGANSATRMHIAITPYRVDKTSICYTLADGVERDYLYVGAYEGSRPSGTALRSVSNATPLGNVASGELRTMAHENGANYYIFGTKEAALLQHLFVMVYGTKNSQLALGKGRTSNTSIVQTGTMNTRPMFYGDQIGADGMKAFYIENLWGNTWSYVDGQILHRTSAESVWSNYIHIDPALYGTVSPTNYYKKYATKLHTGTFVNGQLITSCRNYPELFNVEQVETGAFTNNFCDGCWSNASPQNEQWATAIGGSYNSSDKGGLFYYDYTKVFGTGASATFGARLCRW